MTKELMTAREHIGGNRIQNPHCDSLALTGPDIGLDGNKPELGAAQLELRTI
jgi:hypothetical protein